MKEFDIREAEGADVDGILSIHRTSFEHRYPRLWRLMNQDGPSDPLHFAVENILNTHLNSQDCIFMVAYDVAEVPEVDFSNDEARRYRELVLERRDGPVDNADIIEDLSNLTFGVMSLSIARSAAARDLYITSDLRTFGCLRVLERARATGETHLNTSDSRVRLLYELQNQTLSGQTRCLRYPYLVVNTLLLWPECHRVELRDMTLKLLGWAVTSAERDGLPIWTQIPVNEKALFLLVGFAEVRKFTLNLNHYRPHGSRRDWGTQEWVQMVYFCRHRQGRTDTTST